MYGKGMASGTKDIQYTQKTEVRSSHEGCKFVPPLHQNVTYYSVIK